MSEHRAKVLEETASLRAALPGDAPAGVDLALEPEFEAIKAQLDKLSNLEGGEVDWRFVVERSEELLATRTKDLRLAIWLTAGGVERSGFTGLVRGLAVCHAYVHELWEAMLPKRDKARSNIVLWLSERVSPLIAELKVTLANGDEVRTAAELVQEIDRALADKLGDGFAGIRGLVNATKARVRDIPEPPPPPPPEPSSPPPAAPASDWADDDDAPPAPTTASAQRGAIRAEDALATAQSCGVSLVELARAIVLQDPARAWAYRLHRQGIWLPFERVVLEAGVLALPGPDEETRARLHDLLATARWSELVLAGEEASARHPLWLDTQRFVGLALERLGPAFTDAREAVGRDASDFARRNEALLESRFEDGTLTASPETVDWLEVEAKRWQIGSKAHEVGRDEDRDLASRFAEAKNLVMAGRHAEGLAIAVQLARRGADTRERFRANLDVARLAMNAGAPEIARPILEGLVATATSHDLETWDPSLCARLYAGLYRCLPVDADSRPKVFEVLCRLDPGAALRARSQGTGPTTRIPTGTAARFEGVTTGSAASGSVASPPNAAAAPPAPAPASGNAPSPARPQEKAAESEWADDD